MTRKDKTWFSNSDWKFIRKFNEYKASVAIAFITGAAVSAFVTTVLVLSR